MRKHEIEKTQCETLLNMNKRETNNFYKETVKIFNKHFPQNKFSKVEKESVVKWFVDNNHKIDTILKRK